MFYSVPAKYCTSEWQWHLNRAGIGDAIRGAAIIKTVADFERKQLVLCDGRIGTGIIVNRNISFIDNVISVPQDVLIQELPQLIYNSRDDLTYAEAGLHAQYMIRYWDLSYDTGGVFNLEPTDFRCRELPIELPEKYVVVQLTTTTTKTHAVPNSTTRVLRDSGFPIVVIGSDADIRFCDAPPWAIDLRGQLSIPESMWVVACSSCVIAPETWAPLLGTQLSIPSLIGCRNVYITGYLKYVHRDWSRLRYAGITDDLTRWEQQLEEVLKDAKVYTPIDRENATPARLGCLEKRPDSDGVCRER